MADTQTSGNSSAKDPAEIKFRKKNLWHSFTGSLYRGIGGACFFGLLVTMVKAIIDVTVGGSAGTQAASMFGWAPIAVMGALAAVGTALIYLSERESTKIKVLEDNYRIDLEAKEREKERAQTIGQEQAPGANKKQWAQVTRTSEPAQRQLG